MSSSQQAQNVEISNESSSLSPIEQSELQSLLTKESSANASHHQLLELLKKFPSFAYSRSQAVDWMLKVHDFYSFSAHTVILAVNYFDRFFARFGFPEGSKPWMTHLAAVACLSLGAKMEETHVPLLVDFQVEEAKFVFEAKTIQKTEILVLLTLDWEMNAVTPLSFINHLVRVFGFVGDDLYTICKDILIRALADVEFVTFRPSVMAAAAMLYVAGMLDPCVMTRTQQRILKMHEYDFEKLELDKCCSLLQHLSSKNHQMSPKGVLDALFSSETLNESCSWPSSPSTSSSTEPVPKRTKIHHTHDYHGCK